MSSYLNLFSLFLQKGVFGVFLGLALLYSGSIYGQLLPYTGEAYSAGDLGPRETRRQPDRVDVILGQPAEVDSNYQRLEELQAVSPSGDVWTYFFPSFTGTMISEHTFSMGPGYRSNAQLSHISGPSWVMNLETKHMLLPNYSTVDFFKWAVLGGSKVQVPNRSEDVFFQFRIKAPFEFWMSEAIQIRMLAIADLLRRPRYDLDPDFPYAESRTLYLQASPQAYMQFRLTRWFEGRVGIPFTYRLPLSRAYSFFQTPLSAAGGYMEYGPGVYLNFPAHKQLRFKLGGAFLLRGFFDAPYITDGPVAAPADPPFLRSLRLMALSEIRFFDKLTMMLHGHYQNFMDKNGIYGFNVFSIFIEFEWPLGPFLFYPKFGYWQRGFSDLTYPLDDFSGMGTNAQLEQHLGLALRVVYEHEFHDFDSLFFSLLFQYQGFNNDYPGTRASSLARIKNASSIDILLSIGFYL